jgi:hypothetical protein
VNELEAIVIQASIKRALSCVLILSALCFYPVQKCLGEGEITNAADAEERDPKYKISRTGRAIVLTVQFQNCANLRAREIDLAIMTLVTEFTVGEYKMNKIASLSLAAMSSFAIMLPANASDNTDPIVQTVKLPITVSALVAGVAVGTPVAMVHDTVTDIASTRDSIATQFGGQTPDACQYFVADLVAVPAGLTMGLLNGTYHGVANALNNCSEKPFSAESFCLKDSCYNDDKN